MSKNIKTSNRFIRTTPANQSNSNELPANQSNSNEVLKNKVIVLSAVRPEDHIETSPAGRPIIAAIWNSLPERMLARIRIGTRAQMLEVKNE